MEVKELNWGELAMSALWGLVGSLIGVVGTLGFSIWSDKKAYNRISDKVGELNNTTLSGQHNEISGLLKDVKEDVKDTIIDRARLTDRSTKELYLKVHEIAKIMDKNEGRYENLNLDQREVRNNVNKLVINWETLIKDNSELKGLVMDLKKENEILKSMLKERSEKLQRHQKYEDESENEDDWELEQ